MSRRLRLGVAAPCCVLALVACDAGDKSAKENAAPGPTVRIVSPRMDQVLASGDVQVMLDLRDYVVSPAKAQEGAGNPYAAGSGQHVHVILDNEPYLAVYDASKAVDLGKMRAKPNEPPKLLEEGTHVIRAFPSAGPSDAKGAKWHESRKNAGAFAWVRFHVKARGESKLQDFDADKDPTLTYSRPKGEYALAKDASLLFPLMLDFYVTGCTLSKDGFRVQATLDGKALDPITEWKPQSLPADVAAGEHVVVLDLIDKDGKPVAGPFNHTERKITVK